jgi:hypothetical protein
MSKKTYRVSNAKLMQSCDVSINFDTNNPVTIQYDHKGEGIENYLYRGMYVNRGGHMVWFTAPSYPFKLTTISMSATVSDADIRDNYFTVDILDKDTGNKIWSNDYPYKIYSNFLMIAQNAIWQDLQIPEVIIYNDFYVDVIPHSYSCLNTPVTKGWARLAIDYETTMESTRSCVSVNGKPNPRLTWYGNWYIRAKGYVPLR